MPTYTYCCNNCKLTFELFSSIKNYNEKPDCIKCNSNNTHRFYMADVVTQTATIKKSDSELKTLGDLAMRNTERMSEDEKINLYMKHNSYKETSEETKPLPQGMSRIKKPPKIKWPGTMNKKKRRDVKK